MKRRNWKRWILRRVPMNNYTRRRVYLFLRRQITKGGIMTRGHENMMVYAARYAHGRNTGAALQVVSHILAEWDGLAPVTKETLYKESVEAGYCQEDWQKLRDRYEDEQSFLRRQNPNFKTAILRLASGREKHRLVEKEGE